MIVDLYKRISASFSYWYYQYLILTCGSMLEPVERRIFNTFLVAVLGMLLYTAYVFLPRHLILVAQLVEYLYEFFRTYIDKYQTISEEVI